MSPIRTASVIPGGIIKVVLPTNLKEELRSRQDFLLQSELDQVRHNFLIHAIENLKAAKSVENFNHLYNNFQS